MKAGEVDLAGRNHEVPVDQVHDPIRQVGGEVGAVVSAAVFPQPPRDINPRKALAKVSFT